MKPFIGLTLLGALACTPAAPAESPQPAPARSPGVPAPGSVVESAEQRSDQPAPAATAPRPESTEQPPCVGAHMGANDTWVGGRRRLANGWVSTCTPNEAEIAAMPDSAKKPLTAAQKKAIAERGRQHYEEHRDEFEADAARRAQQKPQPGQPVRVEVTGVK